jgi:hypothetical protein
MDAAGLPARRVRLAPADWARVSFRPRAAALEPRSFDFELFLRHALSGAGVMRRGWERETAASLIPAQLSRQEAWCWLHCTGALSQPRLEARLREIHAARVPEDAMVRVKVAQLSLSHDLFGYDTPQTLRPFYSPAGIAALIVRKTGNAPSNTPRHDGSPWPVLGFASHVAPHLDTAERAGLRERIEHALDAQGNPGAPRSRLLLALLATVGGGERLAAAVASLPDGAWAHPPGNPLWHHWRSGHLDMLAGLPDEARFLQEARRLGCVPRGPSDLRLWLAATEWRHLDAVRDAVIAAQQPHQAATLARILGLAEAPETALAMLEVRLRSRAAAVAAEWLEANPAHTAAGLVPVAMGTGRLARAAHAQLSTLSAHGAGPALAAAARHLPPAQAGWLQHEILEAGGVIEIRRADLPGALRMAFAAMSLSRYSVWVHAHALPPLKVAGVRLSPHQVALVLTALHDTPLGAGGGPGADLLAALRQHADPASLDAFAEALFEQWSRRGLEPSDEWAMGALGHLGGDGCVWKLTPFLPPWSGSGAPRRAIFGLMCLEAIGSPAALMALGSVARRQRPCNLRQHAQEMMRRIARQRGLTCEQLSDRCVPDCGLGEGAGRILDFGRRQLRLVLGPALTPLLRGADGRICARPPASPRGGDPTLARAAMREWRVVKRTLQEVRELQVARLEEAMVNGRRWLATELKHVLLANPLMACLLRSLVLAVYDTTGLPVQSFRVTEDGTLADHRDEQLPLPPHGLIGVAHPAHLDDALRSSWAQLLGDYRIIPPFPQLGRPVHRPDSADLTATEITRHRGIAVRDNIMRGLLNQGRFEHDSLARPSGGERHWRHFPGAGVTAFIRRAPLPAAHLMQQVDAVYFIAAPLSPAPCNDDSLERLTIGQVDAGVMSEVLRLVHFAVSPA